MAYNNNYYRHTVQMNQHYYVSIMYHGQWQWNRQRSCIKSLPNMHYWTNVLHILSITVHRS